MTHDYRGLREKVIRFLMARDEGKVSLHLDLRLLRYIPVDMDILEAEAKLRAVRN